MQEILKNLNKEQLEAVLYNDGPLLLLAGAGTGKTRVLTSKIAYIIKNNLAFPSEILAVTFTNKAANEMRERVATMTNLDVSGLWINTFHSVATRILRLHGDLLGISRDFTIADGDGQLTIVKQLLKELNMNTDDHSPKYYMEAIAKIKDGMGMVSRISGYNFDYHQIKPLHDAYCRKLRQMNMCDFSDLLNYNITLFNEQKEVREYYNRKFKFILVDEYQDTNYVQHHWLKLITNVTENKNVHLTCVGDDDQSIYGWRGAELKNILKFTNDYSKAKILKLERNYRSTTDILEAASTLISHNRNRHKKILYSNAKNVAADRIQMHICNDGKQEAMVAAEEIKKLKKLGKIGSYRDFAILIRAGYQTRIFEDVLLKHGIPYRVVGGLKFYERKEVKDCIAYLKLVNNPSDSVAFERVINVPRRGAGTATLAKIYNFASENDINFLTATRNLCNDGVIKGKTGDKLREFLQLFEYWKTLANQIEVRALMQTIIEDINYRYFLERDGENEAILKQENLDEFLDTLNDFSNLSEFLEHISLVNDEENENTIDSVNLMTIHSAKGLEFDTVFLPNWQEGVFPNPKSADEKKEIEEERRLAYVAITRTKKRLHISYSKYKYDYGTIVAMEPSRFIRELPEHILETVDHSTVFQSGDGYARGYVYVNDDESAYEYVNNNDYGDDTKGTKYIAKHTNHFNSNDFIENGKNRNSGKNKQIMDGAIQAANILSLKKCFHKTFGEGYIKKRDGNRLTIIFKNCGEKTILASFVEMLE